ncbi:hypothetical protein FKM82_028704 [Ascaphus truei]
MGVKDKYGDHLSRGISRAAGQMEHPVCLISQSCLRQVFAATLAQMKDVCRTLQDALVNRVGGRWARLESLLTRSQSSVLCAGFLLPSPSDC